MFVAHRDTLNRQRYSRNVLLYDQDLATTSSETFVSLTEEIIIINKPCVSFAVGTLPNYSNKGQQENSCLLFW